MNYALTNVTVVDGTGSAPQPDTTVIVQNGRIAAVGTTADIPADAEILDLRGKFLIPGLADMHVHSEDRPGVDPLLYVANGITTVREMWGQEHHRRLRRAIDAGELTGPRMSIGSRIVDGAPTLWRDTPVDWPIAEVSTEEQAREAVRQARAEGADFVKVYSRVSAADYLALADEAKRLGIALAGHCPDTMPITEASELGQRSFEHLFGLWVSTSDVEPELRRQAARIDTAEGGYGSWFPQTHDLEWRAAQSYDARKAGRVFARLRDSGSVQVPTLVMHRYLDDPELGVFDDDRLRYLPPGTADMWKFVVAGMYLSARSEREARERRELFQRRLELTAALREAGVPVLAGTDVGTPFLYPGFSLHDELGLLVEAGFTPMQALQAATVEPARYLGLDDVLGTVEVGRIADLVVLDADPLADIANTKRIHSVLLRGELHDPQQLLDSAEHAVQAAVAEPGPTCC